MNDNTLNSEIIQKNGSIYPYSKFYSLLPKKISIIYDETSKLALYYHISSKKVLEYMQTYYKNKEKKFKIYELYQYKNSKRNNLFFELENKIIFYSFFTYTFLNGIRHCISLFSVPKYNHTIILLGSNDNLQIPQIKEEIEQIISEILDSE